MYNFDEMSIVKVGSDICFVKNKYEFNKGLDWSDKATSSIKYARRVLASAFEKDYLDGKEVSVTNFNEDGTADVVTFFTDEVIHWIHKEF